MKPPRFLKNPVFWYGVLFAIFILFRLFVAQEAYFVDADEAKYLKGALSVPKYLTWNNDMEIWNAPGLSFLFYAGGVLFDGLRGPQLIELAFAILFFVYLIKLFKLFGKSDAWIWIAMLFISIAHEMIMMSYRLYKEGVYLAFFVMMLYYFLLAIRGEEKHYITTAIIGAATAYTADHIFLFLPIMFLMLLMFFTKKTSWTKALICLAIIGLVFVSWLGIRMYTYETNDWYPVGVDGVPEYVKDYGFRQILSPPSFPETTIMTKYEIGIQPGNAAAYLAYMLNIEPALINTKLTRKTIQELLTPKPFLFMILIYVPLTLIVIYGVWRSRKFLVPKFKLSFFRNNQPLFFAAMYVILNIFIIYKGFSNRYSLGAAIPLVFFFATGVEGISRAANIKFTTLAKILLAATLVLLIPFHIATHQTFLLTIPFEAESRNTAEFLRGLPEDGIMTQAGYTPEIAWQTHPKRVLSLPRTPDNFDELIEKYDINYVVFGEGYWTVPTPENKTMVWNYDTIDYIRNNPERFEKIATIEEIYTTTPYDRLPNDRDQVFVYRVV